MASLRNLLSNIDQVLLAEAADQELHASHLYLHLANHAQRLGFFGASKFFKAEAGDELAHHQKIADFVNARGGVVSIGATAAIGLKPEDLRELLQVAYDAELRLSEKYEGMFKRATSVTTQQFLLEFLEVQATAIGEYGDWIARLDAAAGDECAALIVDQEMGK